jgi:hypothetical protein
MSMSYAMILVPNVSHLRPDPEAVASFLAGLRDMGALGHEDKVFLRDYLKVSRTIVGRDPRTGETIEIRSPATTQLRAVQELVAAVAGLAEFDAVIAGRGPARLLPVRNVGGYDEGQWKPLQELLTSGVYVEDYTVSVECCQRSRLVSTSDLHEETQSERRAEPFGEACELGDRVGRYSNPQTVDLIEVPNAGCSTFWIAYQLGKWMFPEFSTNKIDFAEPSILQLAETTFRTKFTEGCRWG